VRLADEFAGFDRKGALWDVVHMRGRATVAMTWRRYVSGSRLLSFVAPTKVYIAAPSPVNEIELRLEIRKRF